MTTALAASAPPALPSESLAVRLSRIVYCLEQLGLDTRKIAKKETRDFVDLSDEEWPISRIEALSFDALQVLAEDCGNSLKLRFRNDDLILLAVDAALTSKVLDDFKREAKGLGSIALRLEIDKNKLKEILGIASPHADLQLFLCGDALVNLLAASPKALENSGEVFERADGSLKTVFLVADQDVSLDGAYLAVAGGRALEDWPSYCPAKAPDPAPVRALHDRACKPESGVSWFNFTLHHLTPLQLAVKPKSPAGKASSTGPSTSDPLFQALCRKRLELAMAYLANQTTSSAERKDGPWEWRCLFQTEGAALRFGKPADADSAENLPEAADLFGRRAEWAYANKGDTEQGNSDRLPILRSVLAKSFSDYRPEENYRHLLKSARRLDRDIEGGWDCFVHGRLERYFQDIRQVEELVERTAETFKSQIQALTKDLSSNMLGAVGVVVGSFVAAMFGSPFNAEVFRIGVFLYALYLAIFPGLLGLVSTHEQADNDEADFAAKVESFRRRLSSLVVDDATKLGNPADREVERFRTWLTITAVIYAAMVLLLLLGAWRLPAMV